MGSKKAIITRPEHDLVTKYLSEWGREVISFARDNGIKIKDLDLESANRKDFEKFLEKQKPTLVLLNGHGGENTVGGHKNQPLLVRGDNEKILKGKIVYALSCHSAAKLGPSAVEKGAKAYIGYKGPFSFVTDKNKESVPEEDELANTFKEASNEISLCLIKGKSVKEAYEHSQNKFKEAIRKFAASDALPESKDMRFWLFWDMNFQKFDGDSLATF